MASSLWLVTVLLLSAISPSWSTNPLRVVSKDYYKETCPNAEKIVLSAFNDVFLANPDIAANILRLFFHDVIVNGVDGSVLLDGSPSNPSENQLPSIQLSGFGMVDYAKSKVEEACPGTVSCSDVLVLLTKAAVRRTGGPTINFKLGRLDGSNSSSEFPDVLAPRSFFNASELIATFARMNLDIVDIVALIGAHTIGSTHCSGVEEMITPKVDSRYSPAFGKSVFHACQVDDQTTFEMDSTSNRFDNNYYKTLFNGHALMNSDYLMGSDSRFRSFALLYASSRNAFFQQFKLSMIKASEVKLTNEGNIRLQCGVLNE